MKDPDVDVELLVSRREVVVTLAAPPFLPRDAFSVEVFLDAIVVRWPQARVLVLLPVTLLCRAAQARVNNGLLEIVAPRARSDDAGMQQRFLRIARATHSARRALERVTNHPWYAAANALEARA